MSRRSYTWKIRNRELKLGDRTLLMGVLNVTPDSFSDGGRFLDPDHAYAYAMQMEEQGADIIDIGAESTRPGAEPVSAAEELQRVVPVLKRLRDKLSIPISIDTYKAEVAERALELGAEIVNDPSGFTFDPQLTKPVVEYNAGIIFNHMRGRPQTWGTLPPLPDVMGSIVKDLDASVSRARRAGVDRLRILVDPGLGFGKRREQNSEILARLEELARLELPIMVGPSRKSFLAPTGEQGDDYATASAVTAAILAGAHVVRIHDVGIMKRVVAIADEIVRSAARVQEMRQAAAPELPQRDRRTPLRARQPIDAGNPVRPPVRPPMARASDSTESRREQILEGPGHQTERDFPVRQERSFERPIDPGSVDQERPNREAPPDLGAADANKQERPRQSDERARTGGSRDGRERNERFSKDRPPVSGGEHGTNRPFNRQGSTFNRQGSTWKRDGDRPSAGSSPRTGGDRPFQPRTSGERPYGDRPYKPRDSGARPSGDRPFKPRDSGARPSGDRPFKPRDSGARPSGDRPFKPRDSGARPSGDRPFKPRDSGARPSGDRPFKPRDSDARPSGDRPFKRDFGGKRGDRPPNRGDFQGRERPNSLGDRPTDGRPRSDSGNRSRGPGGKPTFGKPKPFAFRKGTGAPRGNRPRPRNN